MHKSRRDFIKELPALAMALGLANGAHLDAAQEMPELDFPVAPRDRLAVTSYPFRAFIDAPGNGDRDKSRPGMTLLEFPARMIEKFGIHDINPVIEHFASTDPAYLASFREALAKAGSHIVDLGLNEGSFYDSDPHQRQKSIDDGRKGIDVALTVGSPSVRQHVGGRRRAPKSVDLAAESLAKLAEYGARHNIVVNLENDSPGPEDPFFLVQVIVKVNSPYLRALPDFGNSILGHDEEYNERALKGMFAHAFNMTHVKEYVRDEKGKDYHVDLPKVFAIAKASGYRGYFSMEYETEGGDPYEGTQQLVNNTLKCLSAPA
ncbi:MAG: sugar phosphate isomerase/epimerase family protein [Terriglobia bacterium]|jgi:sugar phosphate isomerase/epimerase